MIIRTRAVLAASAVAALLALSACADNTSDGGDAGGTDAAACTPAPAPTGTAGLPDDIKKAGKILVGSDASYAPSEFQDASGKIVGFDVDLFTAIGTKLGVSVEFENASFDTIVAGVKGSKYDVGVSSFTDNCEREKVVDFVDYFSAGTQWAAPVGKTVDPDSACGLTVAVQTGTVQDTDDLPVRQKACKAAGKAGITIQKYEAQSDASTALVLGKVDAMLADSPVAAYAVKQNEGKIQLAGDIYDSAPYGFAIPKEDANLSLAIKGALESMIADGSYAKILAAWGLEAGAVTSVELNGAS
ncbi:MAG: amino acid transporter substrate-binding protein family [Jatrophihabitantaceae bacterium]|nr:amino acid transporter substrate-binding protein family [Jatrophihabitantaceae bacterium]